MSYGDRGRKRKPKNNNLQPSTSAPALRMKQGRRAEIEGINMYHRIPVVEFEEQFDWYDTIHYMGFPIVFKEERMKLYVERLDEYLIIHQELTNYTLEQEASFAGEDKELILKIIKLSFAIDVINQARKMSNPKVVYNVLKTVAQITVNEQGNLVLKDCYGLLHGDQEDNLALFADIIRTHGDYILARIDGDQIIQYMYMKELLLQAKSNPQAFKFKLPPEIVVIVASTFLFIDTVNGKVQPELGIIDATQYIVLFILPVLKKALAMALPVVVIYKILKTIVQMRVSETGREIVFDPPIEGLEALLVNVKDDLMALLLQKKTNYQAHISSLVTKKVAAAAGSNGPSSIDMLFLCGDKECAPVRNSDQLLSWLKNQKYGVSPFLQKVFKTLEIINPTACFLAPILFWFNVTEGKGTLYYEDKDKTFDPTKYKIEQIDTCAARVMQPGRRKVARGVRRLSYARQERPLIAIPFLLLIHEDKVEDDMGHANMLIIDPNKRECEHFEPHGEMMIVRHEKINDEIQRFAIELCKQLFPGYTYIPRSQATNFQVMLNKKFQGTPYGGTCQVWSIWYAYLRLSHPEFPREVIIKRSYDLLANNDFAELENFIVKFMEQLNSIAGMYKVGDKYYNSNGKNH